MFKVWRTRDGDARHDGAFAAERILVKVTRWRVILAAAAAGTYVLGMLAFLPAEAAVGEKRDAVGTVWKGETAVAPAFAAGWTVRPFDSLLSFAGVADARLTGPGTDLDARVAQESSGLTVREAAGHASLRVLNGLAPALPFACDGDMRVTLDDFAVRGGAVGSGVIDAGPATCIAGGGAARPISRLSGALSSDAEGASVQMAGPAGERLVQARASRDGKVSVTVEPAGAAVLPGLTPATLETSL